MKKYLFLAALGGVLLVASPVFAQGMMWWSSANDTGSSVDTQTSQDEAAGKVIWENLQSKQVICGDLKDADFDLLGDFFGSLMMGSYNASMNEAMRNRLGDDVLRQMHVAMGKRLSGCDVSAAYPQQALGYFPMMVSGSGSMMRWSAIGGSGWPALSGSGQILTVTYWVTMVLAWVVLILIIVALAKWIAKQKK